MNKMDTPKHIVEFVRSVYRTNSFIPLHEPTFFGNEKAYVGETIDSTFVSSIGEFVGRFERDVERFTGSSKAVAVTNGSAALHTALHMSGVVAGDLVITQALSFIASCNAILQAGAEPIFVDVETNSFALCPVAVSSWLDEYAELDGSGNCRMRHSGARIKAIMPMHTFGHPAQLDELLELSSNWNLDLIEDAAESLGSLYKKRHTGTIGRFGVLSFNGNKVITTGGGGMLLCTDKDDGNRAKHITTTSKVAHPYEFYHDQQGFNYRLPNLNAALGCAQMENLRTILERKRMLASRYDAFFKETIFTFVKEPEYARSNYWLNTIICNDRQERDLVLKETNSEGVMTRPAWQLMTDLPMFKNCHRDGLVKSKWAVDRLVNLPSSPVNEAL